MYSVNFVKYIKNVNIAVQHCVVGSQLSVLIDINAFYFFFCRLLGLRARTSRSFGTPSRCIIRVLLQGDGHRILRRLLHGLGHGLRLGSGSPPGLGRVLLDQGVPGPVIGGWLGGGIQHFSVSPSPLGTTWVLELILTWLGLGLGFFVWD